MNAVWRSQRHAMLLLTGVTLSASLTSPLNSIIIFAAQRLIVVLIV